MRQSLANYMIFHIYFAQLLFAGLFMSIQITYKTKLQYDVLALFAAAYYPYSIKFFFAPLQEKVYFRSYGKRKTWIVISLFLASFILYYISLIITKQSHIQQMIWALAFLTLNSAFCDVATDALAVEIISNTATLSRITFIGQRCGKIVASSIFLSICFKSSLTTYLGFAGQIFAPHIFVKGLCVFVFLTSVAIHFLFEEPKRPLRIQVGNQTQASLQSQEDIENIPIKDILRHYIHFINPKYEICREAICLPLLSFGLVFFHSTYVNELLNKKLIQRQVISFVSDVISLLLVFGVLLFDKIVTKQNVYRLKEILSLLILITCSSIYFLDIKVHYQIIIAYSMISILNGLLYFILGCILNEKAKCTFPGITITTFFSIQNYSWNSFFQKKIINEFGYDDSIKFGFAFAAVVTLCLPLIDNWIKNGVSIKIKQEKEE